MWKMEYVQQLVCQRCVFACDFSWGPSFFLMHYSLFLEASSCRLETRPTCQIRLVISIPVFGGVTQAKHKNHTLNYIHK